MFKKTLLAATIAVVSTGAAAIDVTTSGSFKFGSEALTSGLVKNAFTALTAPSIKLKVGAAYTAGDLIKVQIAGGKFDKTASFTFATTNIVTTTGLANTTDPTGVLETGFLSASDTEVVFRVISYTAPKSTDYIQLELQAGAAAPKVTLGSTAVGAKTTISASAETNSGVPIDVAGLKDSATIITLAQEHKFTSTKLAANIDVADERKSLTGGTGAALTPATPTDSYTVTYTHTAVETQASFPIANLAYTVNGSFTGFEAGVTGATNKGAVSYSHNLAAGVDAGNVKVAADLQSATVTGLDDLATTETTVFTFTPDASKTTREVLNVSAYSTDVTMTSGAASFTYEGIASGAFTLNGSSAQYAYVPVNYSGAVTTQFEIGNKGKVDGDITLTAFDTDGNKYEATLEKKAEAGKLTKVSDADISTAFGLTKGTKLNLTIVVNAPSGDITYGAYSNRGTTGRMAINKL